MSLNIKDPEAHRLARAVSEATGESMTRAVVVSLQERLERVQPKKKKATVEELLAIADRFAAHAKGAPVDHGEWLYDEYGLPK
jgi:antitoxin VapB